MALTSAGPQASWQFFCKFWVTSSLGVLIDYSKPLSHSSSPHLSISANDLAPLLKKVDAFKHVSVSALYYKQNSIYWLNATFVKSYFVVQGISGRTREPAWKLSGPSHAMGAAVVIQTLARTKEHRSIPNSQCLAVALTLVVSPPS